MVIHLDRVRASRNVRSLLMRARTEALAANTQELLGSIDAALRALTAEETAGARVPAAKPEPS